MTSVNTTTRQLITRAMVAILAAYALTTIHHVYGGLVDQAFNRLLIPIIMFPPLLIVLGSLYRYRRTGGGAAFSLFTIVAMLSLQCA